MPYERPGKPTPLISPVSLLKVGYAAKIENYAIPSTISTALPETRLSQALGKSAFLAKRMAPAGAGVEGQ